MISTFFKKLAAKAGISVSRYDKQRDFFRRLHAKYRELSMVPTEIFVDNLELCGRFHEIDGDYVECGVWRGGMSGAIAEVLGPNKHIHLFDSFEGLPDAKPIDGKEAIQWQRDVHSPTYYDNCKAEEDFAIQAMHLAGHKNYTLHKGWFNETTPKFQNHKIAILRLDGDWYDSVFSCLENLFPKVVDGGLIIIDDYTTWDGCTKAVHDYLSKVKSPSRILQWKNLVSYIVKKNE